MYQCNPEVIGTSRSFSKLPMDSLAEAVPETVPRLSPGVPERPFFANSDISEAIRE